MKNLVRLEEEKGLRKRDFITDNLKIGRRKIANPRTIQTHIESFIIYCAEKGLKNSTVKTYTQYINYMRRWLEEQDIVFVAGLFLWYKQHEQNWRKIPRFFNMKLNDNVLNHSHYFKQISELYEINHEDIFDNFPYASNKQANSFSKYFIPPLYINEENLYCFFGNKENINIDKLKNKYIERFEISDFINTGVKNYKHSVSKFVEYEIEIKESRQKLRVLRSCHTRQH